MEPHEENAVGIAIMYVVFLALLWLVALFHRNATKLPYIKHLTYFTCFADILSFAFQYMIAVLMQPDYPYSRDLFKFNVYQCFASFFVTFCYFVSELADSEDSMSFFEGVKHILVTGLSILSSLILSANGTFSTFSPYYSAVFVVSFLVDILVVQHYMSKRTQLKSKLE